MYGSPFPATEIQKYKVIVAFYLTNLTFFFLTIVKCELAIVRTCFFSLELDIITPQFEKKSPEMRDTNSIWARKKSEL